MQQVWFYKMLEGWIEGIAGGQTNTSTLFSTCHLDYLTCIELTSSILLQLPYKKQNCFFKK